MLGFTRQEQGVVLFLLFTFLVGLGVFFYRRVQPAEYKVSTENNRVEFYKKVALIDSERVNHRQKNDGNKKQIININQANSNELQKVPNIGPVTAQKIIDYRDKNGQFKSLDDLKHIKGIGARTFEKIKSYISLK